MLFRSNYWVHNGFVDMGAEKMSKSLGNVITPEELLKSHKGETLRLALLSAHYRSPLPWTESLIAQSNNRLDRLYRLIGNVEPGQPADAVVAALSDDLNTAKAMNELAKLNDPTVIKASANLLGLLHRTREEHEKGEVGLHATNIVISAPQISSAVLQVHSAVSVSVTATATIKNPRIDGLVAERGAAKKARDFATADRIRDELKAEGVLLEDGPDGTTWRRA